MSCGKLSSTMFNHVHYIQLTRVALTGLFGVGLSLLLMSCTSTPTGLGQSPSEAATPQAEISPAQSLPISAEADIGGQVIQLEVARTPQEQAMGLMYRTSLPSDRGMLFAFEPPRPVQFWMQDTLIPLDMVFMRDGEIKAIVANAQPCTSNPCPTYGPRREAVNQVIELAGGRAAELGLAVGDRITIRFQ
jgi:uncharacterized protein